MKRMTTPPGFAEQLRTAIKASGRSLYELAKAADVPYSAVHGFMQDNRDIRLSTAEAIARAIGLKALKV